MWKCIFWFNVLFLFDFIILYFNILFIYICYFCYKSHYKTISYDIFIFLRIVIDYMNEAHSKFT